MAKRVLSVGQCVADHGSISRVLQSTFGAEVISANTAADAMTRLKQEAFDLVLVNRIFDLDGDSGIDLIRQLKADKETGGVPVVLVSNYQDAQAQAIAAGAQPGFGKASLRTPETTDLLRGYLAD
jgi:CheY-like chemotaxis protein